MPEESPDDPLQSLPQSEINARAIPKIPLPSQINPHKRASLRSIRQETVRIYACLFQDRAKRSFGHLTRMVWNRSVSVGSGIEPDFVTTGGLAIKLKAALLQLTDYFPIAKTREPTHLGSNYDGVIPPLTGARKVLVVVSPTPGFDQFLRNIACDFERLGYGPPLGN